MTAVPQPGRVGSTGARVMGASASLVRGPSPLQRAAGWVLVVMAALTGLLAVGLGASGEAGGLFMCVLFAVVIGVLAVLALRRRTVFDATGIHSRLMLGTRHYPWPDSWGAFMVSISPSGRGSSGVRPGSGGTRAAGRRSRGVGAHGDPRRSAPDRPRCGGRPVPAGGGPRWDLGVGLPARLRPRDHRSYAAGPARAGSQVHDDGAAGLSSAAGADSVAAQEASSLSASWLGEPGSTA